MNVATYSPSASAASAAGADADALAALADALAAEALSAEADALADADALLAAALPDPLFEHAASPPSARAIMQAHAKIAIFFIFFLPLSHEKSPICDEASALRNP